MVEFTHSSPSIQVGEQVRLQTLLSKIRFPLGPDDWVSEISLTIDPRRFTNPIDALQHVRDKRCISRFVNRIHAYGRFLYSPRFIAVLEFHKSGWPHWHVAVWAKPGSKCGNKPFVPRHVVKCAWELGHIRVTARTIQECMIYLSKLDQSIPPKWYAAGGKRNRFITGTGLGALNKNQNSQGWVESHPMDETMVHNERLLAFGKLFDANS